LLTGAGGFIGSNLLDTLATRVAADDLDLHLVRRSPPTRTVATGTVHEADLLDLDAVDRLLETVRPTHLCHLAWLGPETQDRYRSPDNHRWAEAGAHLFRAFARHGGQRLVQVGSCIEYGNTVEGPRTEDLPLHADTAYGQAKAALAQVALDEVANDVSTAVARLFFCFGPHEQAERLVPSIILALDDGRPIDLTEGHQRRDYLDARQAASALWALLGSDATGPFNVGSGRSTPVRELAAELGRLLGRPELLNFGARPDGADSAAEIVADINRIENLVGWAPTGTLEDGLVETIIWWRQLRDAGPQGERGS
jgi:nucleoside-diphosphate-sugar epimerase